jgi:hypothetical protein
MACLNLPIEIHYKPEYLYLCGIIPGPHAPHGHSLNHYLTLLINDLTASWQKGVLYCGQPCMPRDVLLMLLLFAKSVISLWHKRLHALPSVQAINTLVVSVS